MPTAFVVWLLERAHNTPASAAVSIAVPRGAVVEILLEHGFSVFAINPKQLDRFRDLHTVAGAKNFSSWPFRRIIISDFGGRYAERSRDRLSTIEE